jgi:hypothetical protein
MNTDEFDTGMGYLLANWPKEAPPAATLAIYQAALGHLPAELWQRAVVRVITEATFFPRPAELLTAAVRALMERDGHSEAWARLVLTENAAAPELLFPAEPARTPLEAPAPVAQPGRAAAAKQLMAGIGQKGTR